MNPYKEPAAELNTSSVKQATIDFTALLISSATFSLVSFAVYKWQLNYELPNPLIRVLIFVSPWAAGAMFLGLRVHKKWVLNGILYSVLTSIMSFGVLAFNVRKAIYNLNSILVALVLIMVSTAITITTIVLTKIVLRIIQTQSR